MSKIKFDSDIKLVSKQVHPDVLVSANSKIVINNFLNLIINHIIKDVVKNKSNKKEKITPEDIQNSLRNVFGNTEIVHHAISEGSKAVRKFDFYTRETKSKSQRMNTKKDSGLIFQVSKINKFFKENNLNAKIEAQIYLAAVLEYLTAEITELSGNATLDNRKLTSMPHFIFLAIKNDPELILLADNVGWDYKILEKKKSRKRSLKSSESSRKSSRRSKKSVRKSSRRSKKSVRKSSRRSRKSVRKSSRRTKKSVRKSSRRTKKSVRKSSRRTKKSVRKSSRRSRKSFKKNKIYGGSYGEIEMSNYRTLKKLKREREIKEQIDNLPEEKDKILLLQIFNNGYVANPKWGEFENEENLKLANKIHMFHTYYDYLKK